MYTKCDYRISTHQFLTQQFLIELVNGMQTELQTTLQVDKYESRMYVSGYLLPPGDVEDDCEDEADG